MTDLHWADYVIFGALLLVSAAIGPIHMWRERGKSPSSAESYFLAKDSLHIIPTSASLFASFFSASSITSMPLELYTGGAKFFMASVGSAIGTVLGAIFIVPIFYNLKIMSAFQYFQLRYHSPLLRKISTVMSVLSGTFYLGLVTFAPCIALELVTGIPLWQSVIASAAITLTYTVLGGIQAVVIVDFIQAVVMFAGLLAAFIVGCTKIDGGFSRALQIASENGRLDFFDFNPDPRNTYSIYATMLPAIVSSAQIFSTAQASVQRYSSLPSVKQAMWSVMALAPQAIILKLLLLFVAITMFAYYDIQGCDPLRGRLITNPNQLITYYIIDILNYPGLIGLWFAAIFSGSLSTMSTLYNSLAAIIWTDLLKEYLAPKLSPRGTSITVKLISFTVGIISCILAVVFQTFTGSIVRLARSTVSVIGSPLNIAFMAGILFPCANVYGTAVGMVTAAIVTAFLSVGQLFVSGGGQQSWLPSKTANCSAIRLQKAASNLMPQFSTTASPLLALNHTLKQLRSSNDSGNVSGALTTGLLLLSSPGPSAAPSTALNTFINLNASSVPVMPPFMSSPIPLVSYPPTLRQNFSDESNKFAQVTFPPSIRAADSSLSTQSFTDTEFINFNDKSNNASKSRMAAVEEDQQVASGDYEMPSISINTDQLVNGIANDSVAQATLFRLVRFVTELPYITTTGSAVNSSLLGINGSSVASEKRNLPNLPPALIYLFSLSFMLYPFLSLLLGLLISLLVSLCTGGWKSARKTNPSLLVVKNCLFIVTPESNEDNEAKGEAIALRETDPTNADKETVVRLLEETSKPDE